MALAFEMDEYTVPVNDLKDGSNAEDKRADDKGPTPAKPGGDGPDCKAAKEGAGL